MVSLMLTAFPAKAMSSMDVVSDLIKLGEKQMAMLWADILL